MFKRVFLFLLTNILVIATISILITVLGIKPYLSREGIDYTALLIFCFIWGMGGAFISLLLSRWIAKMAMGVQLIDPQTNDPSERKILEIVYTIAQKSGLTTMPEVGIYQSDELNAFATGPTKRRALVAISSGLLNRMDLEQIEGVLGHEISHIANGDMVTMTLLQGVVNAFALFLSRIVSYAISMALARGEDRGPSAIYYVLTIVFDVLFTFLGMIIVAAFSRYREYRADAGGAKLVGKNKMIDALKKLQSSLQPEDNRAPSLAALKISHQSSGFMNLFSTHPPLEARIERLNSQH